MSALAYWCLALGFIVLLVLIGVTALLVTAGDLELHNPFGPFIRAAERRQSHRHRQAEIRLRAELARKGADPEYVAFLEAEARGGERLWPGCTAGPAPGASRCR